VSCLISPATNGAAPVTPRAVPRDPAKSHPPDARLGTADDSHPARDDDNNNKIKNNKTAKYSSIQAHHIFSQLPLSQSLGPIKASGRVFLSKLGRKLADQSGDDRAVSFLFQRLSVLIQRYNAILLHDCFVKEEEE